MNSPTNMKTTTINRSVNAALFMAAAAGFEGHHHKVIATRNADIVATRSLDYDTLARLEWVHLTNGTQEPRVTILVRTGTYSFTTESEVYRTEAGMARGIELEAEANSELDALFADPVN